MPPGAPKRLQFHAVPFLVTVFLLHFATPPVVPENATRVVIDSDPAMGYLFRDIDDGLMLVTALTSPEIDVAGITTTAGNMGVAATTRKALEIVELLDRAGVPVVPGSGAATGAPADNMAARFIARTVLDDPYGITVLATGPLTNLADAIRMDPDVAGSIREVIAVGGLVVHPGEDSPDAPYDLNFGTDPEALRVVLDSEVKLTLIHIELCLDFMTSGGQVRALLERAGDLSTHLLAQTRSWRWVKRGNFVLWDVVALNYLLHPEWYTTTTTGVRVLTDPGGRTSIMIEADDAHERRVRLPMAMAELEDYWSWLGEMLEQAGAFYASR